LGLACYYRRFIRRYGLLTRPLIELLKKNAFEWSHKAQEAFERTKETLCKAPILALPNFEQEFVVETDASQGGIGAVLMQNGRPLAFISRALSPKNQALSVYEKKLLAILFAIEKWHQYLIGRKFIVKTEQQSLKHLMTQRLTTPFQHYWLSKLMGYDFEISYRRGKENVVANALSRTSCSEIFHMTLSLVSTDLW